jgi:TIR domain-containing protein
MRTADFVVLFLSKRSVSKRGYVQREMRQALELYQEIPEGQSFLMVIRLDDCEVPEDLRKYQWLNLTDKDAITQLVTAIVNEWASRQPPGNT